MAEKTYLDKYETNEEKTAALIQNLLYLIEFKGYKISEFDKTVGSKKSYLPTCKHTGKIEFSRLLTYCDALGVSLNKLMTFSYENIAKKAELDAKEVRVKELESELAKLKMQVKLDKQALNEAYQRN